MQICEKDNLVELEVVERIPDHLPTPGDIRLRVRIVAEEFSATGTTWVGLQCFETFTSELEALEKDRNGCAALESLSPGEFQIRFEAVEAWGQIAVSGQYSRHGNSLTFRFNFCPSLLPTICKEMYFLRRRA